MTDKSEYKRQKHPAIIRFEYLTQYLLNIHFTEYQIKQKQPDQEEYNEVKRFKEFLFQKI